MAHCDFCEDEMKTAVGCVEHIYLLNDGTEVRPFKVGEECWVDAGERCGDCNALFSSYHHVGCDVERCAICFGQYVTCSCDYSDKILIVREEKND